MPSNEEKRNQGQEQIKLINDMIDTLKKVGTDVPNELTISVKVLQVAIDGGRDLGDACVSTSAAIARYNNKMNQACGNADDCLARELHHYEAANVDYTLNWNNKHSAVRNSFRNTLRRYVPQRICEKLDWCKSADGK